LSASNGNLVGSILLRLAIHVYRKKRASRESLTNLWPYCGLNLARPAVQVLTDEGKYDGVNRGN